MNTIGPSLRKLRESFGVSAIEVARELDVTDRTVSMLESGLINPNDSFVAKVTNAIVTAHKKKAPGAPAVDAADQEPSQINPNR